MPWCAALRRGVVDVAAVVVVLSAAVAVVLLAALGTGDSGDEGPTHSAASSSEADAGTGGARTTTTTTASASPGSTTTTQGSSESSMGGGGGGGVVGDGVWVVGRDLEAGRYIASGISGGGCRWARLADAAGVGVLASVDDVEGQAIVDVRPTDGAFRSEGCGSWLLYTPPDGPAATTIDSGDWVVGEQVEPGAYLVARSPGCTWARATGFEHTAAEIVQTESSALSLEGPYLVVLEAGQRFTSHGCGRWADAD